MNIANLQRATNQPKLTLQVFRGKPSIVPHGTDFTENNVEVLHFGGREEATSKTVSYSHWNVPPTELPDLLGVTGDTLSSQRLSDNSRTTVALFLWFSYCSSVPPVKLPQEVSDDVSKNKDGFTECVCVGVSVSYRRHRDSVFSTSCRTLWTRSMSTWWRHWQGHMTQTSVQWTRSGTY